MASSDSLPIPQTASLVTDPTAPVAVNPSIVTVTTFTGPTAPAQASSPSDASQVPIGAIVGGTLAGVAIVVIAVVGWIWWGKRIKKKEAERRRQMLEKSNAERKRRHSSQRRPDMKHHSASTQSSFFPKEAKSTKSSVSFEIVSAPAGALPTLAKSAPSSQPPTKVAPGHQRKSSLKSSSPAVTVTPPSRASSPPSAPTTPEVNAKLPFKQRHSKQNSREYRPSPLSRGESFVPPSKSATPPPPPSDTPGASSSTTPSQTRSTPSPPTPPFLRQTPIGAQTSAPASLVSLHAAATTPMPTLSLLTAPESRVNRLSMQSTQLLGPAEWDPYAYDQVGVAWSGDAADEHEGEEVWRGSLVDEEA